MGNQKETQKNPQYKYASTREKLCFGIGAIGKDAICNLVGAFLMLYFTDTLYLAPAFVGVLFFVARIWDAINDPMMGMIVDNTHTRFGKFRIWIVIGTLVNSVVFVLLFHSFNLVVVKHFCNTLFENSPGISSFKWCFPIIVGMRTDMIVPYVHISV